MLAGIVGHEFGDIVGPRPLPSQVRPKARDWQDPSSFSVLFLRAAGLALRCARLRNRDVDLLDRSQVQCIQTRLDLPALPTTRTASWLR